MIVFGIRGLAWQLFRFSGNVRRVRLTTVGEPLLRVVRFVTRVEMKGRSLIRHSVEGQWFWRRLSLSRLVKRKSKKEALVRVWCEKFRQGARACINCISSFHVGCILQKKSRDLWNESRDGVSLSLQQKERGREKVDAAHFFVVLID